MTNHVADLMHRNNLVARERVAHLNGNTTRVGLGPWDLLDTAEPSFAAPSGAMTTRRAAISDIASAVNWFKARGMAPAFSLRTDADAPLFAALQRLGLRDVAREPAMVLRTPGALPTSPPGLEVVEVAPGPEVDAYGTIGWPAASRAIGIAIARSAAALGFVLLMGLAEGRPCATAMAVVTGELVGVYNVSVDPDLRRRGFGAAMTWAAVAAGLSRGARLAWLESSELGLSLYRRMGFRTEYEYVAFEGSRSAASD